MTVKWEKFGDRMPRKRKLGVEHAGVAGVYVVFAPALGVYKVGKTRNLEQRLSVLRSCSPVALDLYMFMPDPYPSALEEEVLKLLVADGNVRVHHVKGEWFEGQPQTARAAIFSALGVDI